MKWPPLLKRWFSQPDGRAALREKRLAKIAKMGFIVDDLSGWHEGKFSQRRYRLVDKDGTVIDNGGAGFVSSSEAYRAAVAARKKSAG